jgi:hypothetical protein
VNLSRRTGATCSFSKLCRRPLGRKNGNYGTDYLAIPYRDHLGVERLFYPDFIIKKGKRVGILDTKAGDTAEDGNAKQKAEALQAYIKSAKTDYRLWGGIVTRSSGT